MAEAELPTIARPYARAAFSFALSQPEGLGKWSRMLALLASATEHPVMQDALDNPMLSNADEADLLTNLLSDELDESGVNFVNVVASYGRLTVMPFISEMFELLKANHEKTMDVSVTSAFEVDAAQASSLSEGLKRMLQREINLSTEVDTSLLGGVIIKAEDTVIDNSVRGKLAKLAQALH